MRNFWTKNRGRYNSPGSMQAEQFDILIRISGIHSEKVVSALKDYYVSGVSRKEACEKNGVSQSYFSISKNKLVALNNSVAMISRYYLPV
ncbi:TPA: PapB/FocB family fimbrial expression transcriptional regulator [Salmonella enterica subsp. enterica serovar Typhimurium]|uniref:PapB/FocB family fimbrial expression transcriptional regulator n=1 Tax=Escherichia coli TaxID=562 RepID=UPI000BE1E7DD|nr:PapB/FocB family fimbrial expression transcriptional regulator [Escherichia coli]MUN04679.1 transcriptional regulator [Escherichia coli]HBA3709473.1 transcriptional regulator [Escherichia coli]